MAHVIQLGQNNTAGKTPDALASGEVAINTSDKKIPRIVSKKKTLRSSMTC